MTLEIQGISIFKPLTYEESEKKYCEIIDQTLKNTFGLESFRPLQREIILWFLANHDVFVLMPTGGGKSLGFQIPSLVFPGITIVISPLISLMQNQVDALKAKGIPSELINSTLDENERSDIKNRLLNQFPGSNNSVKLLYVTPELIQTKFIEFIKKIHSRGLLSAFVIDEAHTVSIWGHNFRPAYRKLSILKQSFPNVPIMACTATATPKVQENIISTLSIHDCKKFVSSFNRPNITYYIRYKVLIPNLYEDVRNLIDSFIKSGENCGIIYCHKRSDCDDLYKYLNANGIKCSPYHARLTDKQRQVTLSDWMSGKVPIVIATIAFGMGIDNQTVRFVIHYTVPSTLEDFYQESGRAGRDQKPSTSILYYSYEDRDLRKFLLTKQINEEKNKKQSKCTNDSFFNHHLNSRLEAFSKLIDFCEQPFCRRHKLLSYFGEKFSFNDLKKLCQGTCDYCKDPVQTKKDIKFFKIVERDPSCFDPVTKTFINDTKGFDSYENKLVNENNIEKDEFSQNSESVSCEKTYLDTINKDSVGKSTFSVDENRSKLNNKLNFIENHKGDPKALTEFKKKRNVFYGYPQNSKTSSSKLGSKVKFNSKADYGGFLSANKILKVNEKPILSSSQKDKSKTLID